jgi:hypothetical protein
MKESVCSLCMILVSLIVVGCSTSANRVTPTPDQATVVVTFDMGTGGPGFTALIYVQEVSTGKTFHGVSTAGSHGLVVLPTSAPVSIQVDAPGTYVFYAVLINEEGHHYGATGCKATEECPSSDLIAIDVKPGGKYAVYIGDRSARIPPTGVPVEVPWHK